ncbi:MAG: hypothetical protein IJ446_05910 [Oscillospiraceae bacterium]|nr:hypothetical protein [Oscillospiraceae bacterium]
MEKAKTVKKKITTVIAVIFMLPVALVCIFILFETIGAAVNITASHMQTAALADKIKNDTDAQVIDTYTFTGNSGGTGNHTDMVSYILIKTDDIGYVKEMLIKATGIDYAARKSVTENGNNRFDQRLLNYRTQEHNIFIIPVDEWDGRRMADPFSEWTYPEDTLNCYIVECIKSAPFRDSIMGH